jgi:hypothetical protein
MKADGATRAHVMKADGAARAHVMKADGVARAHVYRRVWGLEPPQPVGSTQTAHACGARKIRCC